LAGIKQRQVPNRRPVSLKSAGWVGIRGIFLNNRCTHPAAAGRLREVALTDALASA